MANPFDFRNRKMDSVSRGALRNREIDRPILSQLGKTGADKRGT